MANAEGLSRYKTSLDLPFYEKDSVNSELDINGENGQLTLGKPKLSKLKEDFQSSKKTYNSYRSKIQEKKRDIKTLEKLILEDPSLDYHVNKISQRIKTLDDVYYGDKNRYYSLKRQIKHYSRIEIPDIKPVSGIIIDRIVLKDVFISRRNQGLYRNELKLERYREKFPNDYELRYREDVKKKIKLEHAVPEFKLWLETIAKKLEASPDDYNVKQLSFFRDDGSRWMRIDFHSGLGLEVRMDFPFTKKYRFNLITYAKYSTTTHNLVWEQNNYQALLSCINRVRDDLYGLYKGLTDFERYNFERTNNEFEHPLLNELGFSLYRFLNVNINELYVNNIEIHKNFEFMSKRKQRFFHKAFFIFVTQNPRFCRFIQGTAYLQFPNQPKIRVYDKTLELFEKQNVKITENVSRIELDLGRTPLRTHFLGLNLKDLGFFHPEEQNLPDMSPSHFRDLFNFKIMECYQKLSPFDRFMEYVRILGDKRWQAINMPSREIPGVFVENYTLWDLLSDVTIFPKYVDLLFETGIADRTLSRKLAYLSKLGMIEYNRSLREYLLTPFGTLMLSHQDVMWAMFYCYSHEGEGNNCSNTTELQVPVSEDDIPHILLAIINESCKGVVPDG